MRISTAQTFTRSLTAMLDSQSEMAKAQQQVASGKRILSPADDPAGAKRVLDLNQALAATQQFQRNADTANSRLVLEDNALTSANNLLQRVRELAIQANNAHLTDADRSAIAGEVNARQGELVGLANTKDGNNEYLFAGHATQTKPFLPSASGTFLYNGDQGQRELDLSPDFRITIDDSGASVFQLIRNGNGTFTTVDNASNTGSGIINPGAVPDPLAWVPDTYTITFVSASSYEVRDSGGGLVIGPNAYQDGAAISFNGVQTAITGTPASGDSFQVSSSAHQDLFTTVNNLVKALEIKGDGTAPSASRSNAINRFLADVDQGMENLLRVRAGVGAKLNAVENEKAVNESFEVHLRGVRSSIEDIDLAEAITRFNQQANILQAAQLSFSRVESLSLFNFL